MYALADHSSPPIRTRPPFASTRWRTTAFFPSSAAVPVRSAAGMWRCRRAIGRRTSSEATDPPMKTSSCPTTPTPTSATMPAATAARATGPRKNIPGVTISPIARRTAAIAHTTHAGTTPIVVPLLGRPREPERGRQPVQVGQTLLDPQVPVLTVDEDRPHAESTRAFDVFLDRIADHHGLPGIDVQALEGRPEDRRMRLDAAVGARVDDRVHVEVVMSDELGQVADTVRYDGDPQPRPVQLGENRKDVLVELEVLGHTPGSFDLGRAFVGERLGPAHADEDLLREVVPDRLVVQQLGMSLEVEHGRLARLVVASDVERDAVAGRYPRVPARRQLGPRPAKGEVDVEEDRAWRHYLDSSSHCTSATCCGR